MDTDVIVAGAGPAGLMLAAELGLAGVRTVVIEQNATRPGCCRGFNLNARSLALLARRGIVDRFLAEGPTTPATVFAGASRLDLSTMDADHPYVLGIAQTRVEELLEERASELGIRVRWAHRLTGLRQDTGSVEVTVHTPSGLSTLRAAYLVGCDGSRSTVRRLAGIGFPGTPSISYTLLGDVVLADPGALPFGRTVTTHGEVVVIPRPGYVRVLTAEPSPPADRDEPVTLTYLQDTVDGALGRHVALTAPRWLTRFGDAARLADRYVADRVILAGDAAHIHPPAGAVGVNVAIDDAMNLGWKLAATIRGWAPDRMLATYHDERHAVGAQVLRTTRAQALLGGSDARLAPVRELFGDLLTLDSVQRHLAELVTGIGSRCPAEGSHPWGGGLAPDLQLTSHSGPTSVAALLTGGHGVLLDLADRPELRAAAGAWHPRVTTLHARCPARPAAGVLLLRPDGNVAWGATPGEGATPVELCHALRRWFGTPAPTGRR
jgi:2-polyprenyl-6-methoxyphenol hydroxylase-like FAD-dependent oxidoreductase